MLVGEKQTCQRKSESRTLRRSFLFSLAMRKIEKLLGGKETDKAGLGFRSGKMKYL
jgi:hypothetical protein